MEPLYWALVLLCLGVLLVILEVFIPSGGVLGAFAAVAVVASVVVAFTGGVRQGLIVLTLALVVVPAVVGAGLKVWPKTPMGRRILCVPPSSDDVLPAGSRPDQLRALVGKTGIAITEMLPSGDVVIEGKTFDAISSGVPIDAGQSVRVIDVRTGRIVVRPDDSPPAPLDQSSGDVLSQSIETIGLDPFDDPLA